MSPDAPPDFEATTLPHLDAVRRFALSLAHGGDDADDLVQETYLRAQRGWHTFIAGSDARPWLFTICRNTYIRILQQQKRYVESEEGDLDSLPAVRQHAMLVAEGYGELLNQHDARTAIRHAVDALPEPHRSILALVDLNERSYHEAAEILGVPIGTVRSRLYRARRMVQERLRVHAEDAGLPMTMRPPTPPQGKAMPSPLDCETAMRQLWAYLDNDLSATDTAAVRAHVESCVRCQPHVEFEARLLQELAALSQEEPEASPALRERVLERLRAAGVNKP